MQSGFFLLLRIKQHFILRDRLGEQPLNKKELGFDDLGNSQFIQVAKDTKMRRFPARKACSGENTRGVPEPPFARAAEDPRFRAFDHTEGASKRVDIWFRDPLSHLSRRQERSWDYLGKICGGTSCLTE